MMSDGMGTRVSLVSINACPRAIPDKNKLCKVGLLRLPANFITFYEADQQLVPHALTLGKYGQGAVTEGERWVLLEADV